MFSDIKTSGTILLKMRSLLMKNGSILRVIALEKESIQRLSPQLSTPTMGAVRISARVASTWAMF